jgi:hypothetical protein
MDQSLGQKIDKNTCGPQFDLDKKCKEVGTFARSEKVQDSIFLSLWINENSKIDANLLKMLTLN